MRYLVFPKDALNGGIRHSEHFPTIVSTTERYPFQWNDSTDILEKVFRCEPFEPRDGKEYVIVPINEDARIAKFKKVRPVPPPKEYTVEVRQF